MTKKRTPKQSRCIHKYCEMVAESLNDCDLSVEKAMRHDIEIPWNKTLVKELLWKIIQEAMTDKTSTTELTTVEPSEIYNVLTRFLGEKFGIYVPWPSNESD